MINDRSATDQYTPFLLSTINSITRHRLEYIEIHQKICKKNFEKSKSFGF